MSALLPFDLASINTTAFSHAMESDIPLLSGKQSGKNAKHLCVLVHGLWGNPSHLDYLKFALREKYDEEQLAILVPKSNCGSLTYDGIQVCGERVAREIEDTLEQLVQNGCQIRKLSIVGYSLGGLMARYAIGLLYFKGWFDKIEAANFTTFATPHVGVRTPLRGYHLWNVLGARALSLSGRQLFMIDSFKTTRRPLLSVLADPGSIFMHALFKFENRCLYANIVNDKAAVYYTTCISKIDPFADLDMVEVNYAGGYSPVVLDCKDPFKPNAVAHSPSTTVFLPMLVKSRQAFGRYLSLLLIVMLSPILVVFLLAKSIVLSVRSSKRIQLHEAQRDTSIFGTYRIPGLMEGVQNAIEDAIENINATQSLAYIPTAVDEKTQASVETEDIDSEADNFHEDETKAPLLHQKTKLDFPTLALTNAQFKIIEALNDVGFHKHPVFIHNTRHSHGAIINRIPRKAQYHEGKIVIKHWLDQGFKI